MVPFSAVTVKKERPVMTVKEKMISLVDFDAVMEAFKVTVAKNGVKVDPNIVVKYLEMWAEAKEGIFTLFGESLTIKEDVEFAISKADVSVFVKKLYESFPKYAVSISMVNIDDWLNGTISERTLNGPLGLLHGSIFKKGKKITKAISELFCDPLLDIELSKYLQNKMIKGSAVVSIHPLDFITLSTNKHNITSCMDIINGFNKSGCYSLMLDKSTAIAYQCKNSTVTYENDAGAFDWNDKNFRQIIIFNSNLSAFGLGHSLGVIEPNTRSVWIKMIKNTIGGENKWKSVDGGCAKKAGAFYYDISMSEIYYLDAKPTDFSVGVHSLICVVCGELFNELISYSGYICHKKEL